MPEVGVGGKEALAEVGVKEAEGVPGAKRAKVGMRSVRPLELSLTVPAKRRPGIGGRQAWYLSTSTIMVSAMGEVRVQCTCTRVAGQ